MPLIPFYGAQHPDLFALERAAMDRPGKVIAALDRHLPRHGRILDIGAGDGFTAVALARPGRTIIPLEPDPGMIRPSLTLPWLQGDAAHLPFAANSFAAAYSTWAYFFPGFHDITPGLAEVERVVRPGGPILIVQNLGADEFTAFSDRDIAEDPAAFTRHGFACEPITTTFTFNSLPDAQKLLGFYFGEKGARVDRTEFSYRVGVFYRRN